MWTIAFVLLFSVSAHVAPVSSQAGNCCCRCGWSPQCRCGWVIGDYWTSCGGVGPCSPFCCNCEGGCREFPPIDASRALARYRAGSAGNGAIDLKTRFAEFDLNADGFIYRGELSSALSMADGKYGKQVVNNTAVMTHFAVMDADGDGRLSWSEFEKQA